MKQLLVYSRNAKRLVCSRKQQKWPPLDAIIAGLVDAGKLTEAADAAAVWLDSPADNPVATWSGSELQSVSPMPVRTVTIGLTVDGAEVPSGWAQVSKGSGSAVLLTVTVNDTGISGEHTLPVRTPAKVLPLALSFTEGAASHSLDLANSEVGEYEMAAQDVADYLRRQFPDTAWQVGGGAKVVVR
jgi:hypothetical protein